MKKNDQNTKWQPLKKAIENKVTEVSLNNKQYQNLNNMINSAKYQGPVKKRFSHSNVKLVASTFVILAFAFMLNIWKTTLPNKINYISQEVIKNHLKLKPLDIKTQSINDIQGYFTLLDFSPIQTAMFNNDMLGENSTMLGGRYCSISGVTAAQLRYQFEGEKIGTLYQVNYDSEVFGPIPNNDIGETPIEMTLNGLSLKLWTEKGLLMVMVKPL